MLGVQKRFSTLEGIWKERGFRFSSSSHSICSSSSSILSAQHPACHFQGGEEVFFFFPFPPPPLLPHDMMDLRIWGIKIMLWRKKNCGRRWVFSFPSSKGKIKAFIFGFFLEGNGLFFVVTWPQFPLSIVGSWKGKEENDDDIGYTPSLLTCIVRRHGPVRAKSSLVFSIFEGKHL